MPEQPSEEEGFLETVVKAMKSPFMTSVVIIRHKKKNSFIFLATPGKIGSNSFISIQ